MRTHVLRKDVICTPVLFLISLLLLPSCASQQDVLSLNQKIRTLNKEVANMKSVREKQAETGAEMDSVKQEIQRVSGGQEENKNLIKHIIERDTSEQEDLNARLQKLEKKIDQLYRYLQLEPQTLEKQITAREAAPKETVVIPPPKAPETLPVKEETPDTTGNALYEETLATYHEEKYEEAIAGFKEFLKQYPSSKLADNAQFWIGESYMSQKKYDQAIVAFQDVIEKYPDGNKVPNALLKQALAFYEIKDTISCRAILKKIIKKFPDSAEAKIAEAKLKTIK
jgi:tol-pal system protein YbgF